jgi:hypothetical protein
MDFGNIALFLSTRRSRQDRQAYLKAGTILIKGLFEAEIACYGSTFTSPTMPRLSCREHL